MQDTSIGNQLREEEECILTQSILNPNAQDLDLADEYLEQMSRFLVSSQTLVVFLTNV